MYLSERRSLACPINVPILICTALFGGVCVVCGVGARRVAMRNWMQSELVRRNRILDSRLSNLFIAFENLCVCGREGQVLIFCCEQ